MRIESLMKNWENSLASYGTPGNFADDTLIKTIKGEALPITLFESSGYVRRREFMDKIKKEKIQNGEEEIKCFLCDNVRQAKSKGNNLTLPFEEYKNYILCPNRFPFARGHFLLISKYHDSSEIKVGNTITQEYLDVIKNICEKYDLVAMRNHKFAGMSIPDHEHCHLIPRLLKDEKNKTVYCGGLLGSTKKPTPFNDKVFFTESDLDTIAFDKSLENNIIEYLRRLEKEDIIFTFVKDNEYFYLTPHQKQCKGIGSGDTIYLKVNPSGESFSYDSHINLLKESIFTKGAFPWQKYIN
ncbi:MAG: DUF4922 domain-containing protein [Candidatus Nanoarchaeia archaeon]|nr:DUF4922 domain-containing protein [Candidatus Nanoarchaeia archaeon]MDD5358126.1 DUF4922 domain-containing protein [Candidatus Nanoarchaeia archaeon]MDD5589313.1 DUF4922 domain-containing protein [Candidatus Nanoarchaeia archaeon]